jgi:prolyl oligopeptidase
MNRDILRTSAGLEDTRACDPYRWLEDRNSSATDAWLASQVDATRQYFSAIERPEALRNRVISYLCVDTIHQLARVGERYFYLRRFSDQEQPCICVNGLDRKSERVLVDPGQEVTQFRSAQIYASSRSGDLLACKLRRGGEHSCTVHIVRTENGTLCAELGHGEARGLVFARDLGGFFYCHEQSSENSSHEVGFRSLVGPDTVQVVLRLPRSAGSRLVLLGDGNGGLGALFYHRNAGRKVTDLYLARSSDAQVWDCLYRDSKDSFVPFLHGDRLLALTHDAGGNGRVVEFSATTRDAPAVIVPEGPHPIRQLCITRERIFAAYLVDLEPVIQEWSLSGTLLGTIKVERDTTITLCAPLSTECEELFYLSESFTEPPALHCYDPYRRTDRIWHSQDSPSPKPACRCERTSYRSSDGTAIPIYVVHPANCDVAGKPTIMTAYGGFGASMTPRFSVLVSILLELGFTFVLPLIRGGGERGKAWHDAGRRHLRQNSVDDFLSAGDWLVKSRLTTSDRLAIFGGSHSGLLVATAMTQRPTLFRAVLAIAPLTDMLRYHLFDNAGRWVDEYGVADNQEDLAVLSSYSPYRNVQTDVNYPSALFVCGDMDTKCNPAHSRKMVARLQHRSAQRNPILLDHIPERGHSPHLPLSVRIAALVKRLSFFCHEMDIPLPLEWPQ